MVAFATIEVSLSSSDVHLRALYLIWVLVLKNRELYSLKISPAIEFGLRICLSSHVCKLNFAYVFPDFISGVNSLDLTE